MGRGAQAPRPSTLFDNLVIQAKRNRPQMSDDALSMVLGALARLEGNLAKVQEDVTFLLAKIQDDLTALRADLTSQRGDLKSLRVDVMARLDRHENHLTTIRDDISVAMGRTEHMRRVHDNTREEVRDLGEQLGTMWRKVNRLEEVVRSLFGPRGRGRQGMSRRVQPSAGPDAFRGNVEELRRRGVTL